MTYGLLYKHQICNRCNKPMLFAITKKTIDECWWRCAKKSCRLTKRVRCGSFFKDKHVPLNKCIMIIYYWSLNDVSQATTEEILKVSSTGVVMSWFGMLRDLCTRWIRDHPIQIGGHGHTVLIAKNLISHRKRSRNGVVLPLNEKWVFGAIDQDTKETFLVEVYETNAETSLPILLKHLLPGTTVCSKDCNEYNKLMRATDNQSILFVAPTGPRKNIVENLWRCMTDKLKRMRGTSDANTLSYLDEFLWHRQRRNGDRSTCFQKALELIRTYYPCS
ncbi:hypothetical protein HELRODRAFT_162396 [Helobdella robusta]|uniref:ISXO2-like transposase domain-containing protein n=1 Tax=Helobdella robusta TaxID=6412 RepID=T1ESL7_HELRO|nr:hypothetical protein HELRODRAFT_162396 [Helobdella robusta]ESN98926.1 hypothetical protein HELRODRAFT_162396 [Helobdella robusta]